MTVVVEVQKYCCTAGQVSLRSVFSLQSESSPQWRICAGWLSADDQDALHVLLLTDTDPLIIQSR